LYLGVFPASNISTAPAAKKKQASADGGMWLPPEKMTLVHEKKAEIEKVFVS
jgi:hypothetical protein